MTALVWLAVLTAYVVTGVVVANRCAQNLDMDRDAYEDSAALGVAALVWPVIVLLAALAYLGRFGPRSR